MSAARTLQRYGEIAAIFTRYGLQDVAARLQPRRLSLTRPRGDLMAGDDRVRRARRLRLAFEELGPTFIKFGQALSTRADLFSPAVADEFARLQDQVPPLPPGEAEAAIERTFGQPIATIFPAFDPVPIGSASIAQVHRARLPDGTWVAVKVRRPGIETVIETDLRILTHVARGLEQHAPHAELVGASDLVHEFARTIRHEQDLAREGRLIERFTRNFSGDPTVRFPRVYWERTRPAVLVLEYVEGTKVSDLLAGANPQLDRREVARRGADAVLRQVLVHGLFHADPHPGNMLVLPDNVICLLDFGIVGRMIPSTRQLVTALLSGIAQHDAAVVTRLLGALATPLGELHHADLEHDVADLLDSYGDARLADLSFAELWRQAFDLLSRHRLKFPSDLMLLVKALATIEGVGRQLDPSFQMMAHAGPFVERLAGERLAPAALASRMGEAGLEALEMMGSWPREMDEVLHKLRTGRLGIQVTNQNLAEAARHVARSTDRLALAVLAAGFLVGAALLMRSDGPWGPLRDRPHVP
jgi:ubiquinone biosynthesis protein